MNKLLVVCVLLIFNSCSNNDNLCSEIRPFKIMPAKGVGFYRIGMTEDRLVKILCRNHKFKESKPWFSDKTKKYYFIKNMSFVLENDRVSEIVVWGSFKGSFDDIDLDYDKEFLQLYYGELTKYEGEYRLLKYYGIAFGLENSSEGKYIRIFK